MSNNSNDKITIFSTKAIHTGELFGDGIPVQGNAQKYLDDYFGVDSFTTYLRNLTSGVDQANLKNEIKTLIEDFQSHPTDEKYSALNAWGQTAINVDLNRLENLFGRFSESIQYIVKSYITLKPFIKSLANISGCGEHVLYQPIFAEDSNTVVPNVYGLKCLDMAVKGGEWIKCLAHCAVELSTNKEVDLQLVLHDKDVIGYEGKDVAIPNKEELKNLMWDTTSYPKLDAIKTLSIVFFQHTINPFARIVAHRWSNNNNDTIYQRIEKGIKQFCDVPNIDNKLYE